VINGGVAINVGAINYQSARRQLIKDKGVDIYSRTYFVPPKTFLPPFNGVQHIKNDNRLKDFYQNWAWLTDSGVLAKLRDESKTVMLHDFHNNLQSGFFSGHSDIRLGLLGNAVSKTSDGEGAKDGHDAVFSHLWNSHICMVDRNDKLCI